MMPVELRTATEHNVELTGAHLLQPVRVGAEQSAKAGVDAADVVAVKLPNRGTDRRVVAAWRLGATPTPVDPAQTRTEVEYQLSDSSARARSSPRTRAGQPSAQASERAAEGPRVRPGTTPDLERTMR